ncbi:hypothetical protein QE152_g35075 [Popillia japonica]|uniref:Uncharacterized protein n=1 Tax=Popillia japonica TaxID=7064 RepID=A0AAW1ISR5_POPJA
MKCDRKSQCVNTVCVVKNKKEKRNQDNQQLQLQRHLYTADTTAQLLVTTNNKRSEDGCVRGKTNGREQIKRR